MNSIKDFDFTNKVIKDKLSVVIMADSFFYAYYKSDFGLIAHQSFENLRYSDLNNESFKSEFSFLQKFDCQSIHVLAANQYNYLGSKDQEQTIINLPGLAHQFCFGEEVVRQQIINYFGLTVHQVNLLEILFGSKEFVLSSIPAKLNHWYKGRAGKILHIHFEKQAFYVFGTEDNKPLFNNLFRYESSNDVIYFIGSVAKEIDFNHLNDKIYISGWIEQETKIIQVLSAYFGHVTLAKEKRLALHPEAPQYCLPHHYFLHYLNVL